MEVQVESNWLNLVNPEIVELHPLQFANCKRLNKHNVVYLFDEVGSGKTISSGIMALEYLENNPNENILVITTNALAQKTLSQKNGQFKGDWLEKLPFEEYESKITVVNNHHSKFKKPEKYGLVIIDEAHLFLNAETERYQNLSKNIQAKKVVFLTATPIKETSTDLGKYVSLAGNLLEEKFKKEDSQKENLVDDSWINNLTTYGKEPSDLISSQFSLDVPITRYFKDTIKSLSHEGFNEIKAKRYEILTWEYSLHQDKKVQLAHKLDELYNQSNKNKFVVFTRYVEKEAHEIGIILENFGFVQFERDTFINKQTYKIVTGENRQDLAHFATTKQTELPTVLILTYQIAEQGVNLPGFNYIVNYHISSFPSALEQRYGRIDRLNSNHEIIYNCFLISNDPTDTNTFNFYSAIYSSVHSLLSTIPSRNTLLSKKTLQYYLNAPDLVKKHVEGINNLLTGKNLADLYVYLKNKENQLILATSGEDTGILKFELVISRDLQRLISFAKESQVDLDFELEESEAIQQLEKDLKEALIETKRHFNSTKVDKSLINELLNENDSIWDQIFYCKDRKINDQMNIKMHLDTADAIEDCAKTINKNPAYQDYLIEFNNSIRLPLEFKKYSAKLNSIFEEAFIANEFEKIFPQIFSKNYSDVLTDIENMDPLVKENLDSLIPSLPFFNMVNKFKGELIQTNIANSTDKFRSRWEEYEHPFATAVNSLAGSNLTISEKFYEVYFKNVDSRSLFTSEIYTFQHEDGNEYEGMNISPWLKLAYHLTRKESLVCISDWNDSIKLKVIKICSPKEVPLELKDSYKVTSLFHHMFFTKDYKSRVWVEHSLMPNLKYRKAAPTNDYWTMAITNDIELFKGYDLTKFNI